MDMEAVGARLKRILQSQSEASAALRSTVDRLRNDGSCTRFPAAPWHGFCETLPLPQLQLSCTAPRQQDGAPAAQSIVLGQVTHLKPARGAFVRILATWPAGTIPLEDAPLAAGTGPPSVAFLHGSRAHAPHTAYLGREEASVLLPRWLIEDGHVMALVVSATGAKSSRVALSLCTADISDVARRAAVGPLLGEFSIPRDGGALPEPTLRAVDDANARVRAAGAGAQSAAGSGDGLTFSEHLAVQRPFHHPHAAARMRTSMGLPNLLSCLPPPRACVAERVGGYEKLRHEQNVLWAAESVARGVAHARAGALPEAMAAYAHALELDRTHADAYVARGAALANAENYHDALGDFERALRYAPTHPNARSYLEATRERLQQREPPRSPRAGSAAGPSQPPAAARSGVAAAATHLPPPPPPLQQQPQSASETQAAVLDRVEAVLREQRAAGEQRERERKRKSEGGGREGGGDEDEGDAGPPAPPAAKKEKRKRDKEKHKEHRRRSSKHKKHKRRSGSLGGERASASASSDDA